MKKVCLLLLVLAACGPDHKPPQEGDTCGGWTFSHDTWYHYGVKIINDRSVDGYWYTANDWDKPSLSSSYMTFIQGPRVKDDKNH